MVAFATQVKRRRGTTAQNDAFTGAEGEIVVDIERHELRVHDGVTQGGFKIGGAGGAMPVGAIFTTPRTGAIEGAVEANGNPYNIADYSGDGSIGALLTAGNIAYVSKAEFQTQVTNTGACGSFGWDGTSDTTFLVPKLKPWHVGKNAPVVGNGMSLGFTNGTDNYGVQNWNVTQLNGSPFSTTTYGTNNGTAGNASLANNTSMGITTDPTKSGMIADLSETTNLRVMVQLATGATDQALETCTSVLSDVLALNAHRVIEFQAPTAENNYTWYRKYADGWVEQGGIKLQNTDSKQDLTLLIEMNGSTYSVLTSVMDDNLSDYVFYVKVTDKTTTGFKTTIWGSYQQGILTSGYNFVWQVSGMSAQ